MCSRMPNFQSHTASAQSRVILSLSAQALKKLDVDVEEKSDELCHSDRIVLLNTTVTSTAGTRCWLSATKAVMNGGSFGIVRLKNM